MLKQPTDAQIETAIEWLKCFEADVEIDNGKDITTVVEWLEDVLDQRTIRSAARNAGLPVKLIRKKIAENRSK